MSRVVFDKVQSGNIVGRNRQRACQRNTEIPHFLCVLETIGNEREIRPSRERIEPLSHEIGLGVTANCDVRDISSRDASDVEASLDRERRKSCAVLDASETFLL